MYDLRQISFGLAKSPQTLLAHSPIAQLVCSQLTHVGPRCAKEYELDVNSVAII